jgi:mannose-6-phosphate isomerase-like protein (cupin superfamily)
LHEHPYPEVFLSQEGEATFTVGEEELVVAGGHVVVVPPRTPHRLENTGEGTLHMVSIHPSGKVEQTDLSRTRESPRRQDLCSNHAGATARSD